MPEYRRAYVPGGTFFFTLVTYKRIPLFQDPKNIASLRVATARVRSELPFEIVGAAILPDHLHFLWTLPANNSAYSKRISRVKVLFTRTLKKTGGLQQQVSTSRHRHRESAVWQRRFWEHTIRDETDLERHLDYIHYNPVKHGLVTCPHLWKYSSFQRWVDQERYRPDWGCACGGRRAEKPDFSRIAASVGE